MAETPTPGEAPRPEAHDAEANAEPLPPPLFVPLDVPPHIFMSPPSVSVEGRVTRMLPDGFLMESHRAGADGTLMHSVTRVKGRLKGLRAGHRVSVFGGFSADPATGDQVLFSGTVDIVGPNTGPWWRLWWRR